MTIAFRCPHCQKAYQVKDEYAGRTSRCQGCQQTLRIPAAAGAAAPASPPTAPLKPPAPPAAGVPAAAAPPAPKAAPKPPPKPDSAAVKPAPKPVGAAAVRPAPVSAPAAPDKATPTEPPIKLNCFYCEAAVEFPAHLANKQAPCPECRRIIKVPAVVKQEPRDWRAPAAQQGLAGARRNQDTAPDDAWGGSGAVGTVSQQALLQAGVIKEKREPVTVGEWTRRGGIAASVLFVVGGVWWLVAGYLSAGREQDAVDRVRTALGTAKPGREAAGELYRALGEYYLTLERFSAPLNKLDPSGKTSPATAANTHFTAARGALMPASGATAQRQALLIDLGRAQVQLGGTPEQVRDGKRLDWEAVIRELQATLGAFGPAGKGGDTSPVARTEFLHAMSRELIVRGQGPLAIALAATAADDIRTEALAIVGLELWRAGQTKEAEALAESLLPTKAVAGVPPPPVVAGPGLVALCVVLNREDQAREVEAKAKGAATADCRLGRMEGKAGRNQAEAARAVLTEVTDPADHLRARAILAAAGLDKTTPDAADLASLLQVLGESKDFLADPTNHRPDLSWQLWRVARLAARANQGAAARTVADAVPDPVLRGSAQLEVFRAALARKEAVKPEDVDPTTPAHALAIEALARQAARAGRAAAMEAELKTRDEAWRPFGYIGVALGLRDG